MLREAVVAILYLPGETTTKLLGEAVSNWALPGSLCHTPGPERHSGTLSTHGSAEPSLLSFCHMIIYTS